MFTHEKFGVHQNVKNLDLGMMARNVIEEPYFLRSKAGIS